jgi:hypothetical protein
MNRSVREAQVATESNLPRRDWILLPAIGILTIGTLLFLTEFIARRIYTESRPFIAACMKSIDPHSGGRAEPNSTCWDKKFETERVEYRFNACGHRDEEACGTKVAGTFRIVLVGSSVAMGSYIDQNRTLAALLPAKIAQESRRPVEVYNEGMVTVHPFVLAQRMREVLAAKPDLILWVLTPFDIQVESTPHELNPLADAEHHTRLESILKVSFAHKSLAAGMRDAWMQSISRISRYATDTAAGTLVLHLLYASQSQYLKSYLASGDSADYLNAKESPIWSDRLRYFAEDAASIHASAAGVPIITTLIPSRAQAAMISAGDWPRDIDPYKLDKALSAIISARGGTYLEISSHLSQVPDAEKYYFPIDGHPNPRGHEILSSVLARALVGGAVPALISTSALSDHGI